MKLSKKIKANAKYFGFRLPLKAKPMEVPYKYFEREKISFEGGYYLQTLFKKVYKADNEIKDRGYQIHGWGCGNSGLSRESMTKLNTIFQFQSMGSCEYEGGDLGRSYNYLISHFKDLSFNEYEIYGQKFYTVSLNYHVEFLENTLTALVANNQFNPYRISKEAIHLHRVVQKDDKNFVGAWHIKSNYVFFSNKSRFLKFKKLLQQEAAKV